MATFRIECRHCWETTYATTRPPEPVSWSHFRPRPAIQSCPVCGRRDTIQVHRQDHTSAYHEHVRRVWHEDKLPLSKQAWRAIRNDLQVQRHFTEGAGRQQDLGGPPQ